MTRVLAFGSPYLLGFDHFERLADRLAKTGAEGYPPYNIEQTGEDVFHITLAVAGFAPADLNVTVEDNQLVIRGKQTDDGARSYLHRGIAARQFQRAVRKNGPAERAGQRRCIAGLLRVQRFAEAGAARHGERAERHA